MCGLTGVAVHPVHGNVKLALKMLPALLRSIEKRGSHATGIAVLGGSDPFILKAAVPATEFVKSVPFNDAMQGRVLKQATPSVFLGHTRHAFVAGGENNAHRDDCAHPFSEGRVIGAHNGVIYNWRALEQQLPEHTPYEVDSQVIFGLLNQKPSPADALEALEGYFALSWMKHGSLFLASSSAGSLYAAYMQRQRMLVWHSEQRELLDMLLSFGIKAKIQSAKPKDAKRTSLGFLRLTGINALTQRYTLVMSSNAVHPCNSIYLGDIQFRLPGR